MAESTPAAPVAILLSTFNGAAFLPDQLASLRAQAGAGWRLFWRDDGSDDASVALLQAFMAEHAGCEQVTGFGHLGVTESYMVLLRHAVARGAGVVAFADQDDVWLPDKLAAGLSCLGHDPAPVLYCSRQILVGESLSPLSLSEPVHVPPGFGPALTQNIATGCTVMLNPPAAALVAGSTPPPSSLHDWWSYLVVTGHGGRIIADARALVKYRQHGRNAVGAPRSKRQRAMAALRRGPGAFMKVLRAHVAALQQQPHLLSPAGSVMIGEVSAALAAGPLARLRVIRRFPLLRQTRAETLLFRCWFLLG
ncbi:MAG: glycosyltransferase [Janthinobacterium lividum]